MGTRVGKKLFLLHLGPDPVDVRSMAEALAVAGVTLPVTDDDLVARAEVEILRTHQAAGLRRKEVEGAWAQVCRRARKAGASCFVSMPAWAGATHEQAALALDGLPDFRVVVVTTSGFAAPPRGWLSQVADDRFHVLPSQLGAAGLAAQVARIALIEEQARLERRLARARWRRRLRDRRPAA